MRRLKLEEKKMCDGTITNIPIEKFKKNFEIDNNEWELAETRNSNSNELGFTDLWFESIKYSNEDGKIVSDILTIEIDYNHNLVKSFVDYDYNFTLDNK